MDEAWDRLENGWELDEHSDRKEELEKRKKEVAAIKAKFPKGKSKGIDAKRESELTTLENSWSEWTGLVRGEVGGLMNKPSHATTDVEFLASQRSSYEIKSFICTRSHVEVCVLRSATV